MLMSDINKKSESSSFILKMKEGKKCYWKKDGHDPEIEKKGTDIPCIAKSLPFFSKKKFRGNRRMKSLILHSKRTSKLSINMNNDFLRRVIVEMTSSIKKDTKVLIKKFN